jgi:hypothetical protein
LTAPIAGQDITYRYDISSMAAERISAPYNFYLHFGVEGVQRARTLSKTRLVTGKQTVKCRWAIWDVVFVPISAGRRRRTTMRRTTSCRDIGNFAARTAEQMRLDGVGSGPRDAVIRATP